ncbi:carboxypeptidase regulatory-like domain-containing protein [uncultured Capnocytophaga sp.]|uniref:carboxypeptidase regulatory-like domain-containing protein n=1 Tax=uncultured Capnocytophaga sp. TaxID=159273 RepID=UPI002595E639|nr:carboxypeptidase regulatory-like domain-containing protein [uncultured Capnocytophaga sp.]
MKYLLLLLFSLPLTAQVKESQGGGIKDIGEISNKTPLYLIDGKKFSEWSLKTKKLQPKDIAEILVFFTEEAKNLFGNSAKYGAVYIITKETFQKAEALVNNPPNRQLNRKEQLYAEIWEVYQTRRSIVVSGKVSNREGKPLANIRVYNKDSNTEVLTDSIGNYTIQARRWEAIQAENIEDCYLVVKEAKEQSYNFVQHPPIERRSSDPRASTLSVFGSPCDKLFVLDGVPMENKKSFLAKIRNKKIEKIIELDEQQASMYGSLGAYGVIIVNTKK